MAPFNYFVCSACAKPADSGPLCLSCGSTALLRASNESVVELPVGSRRCDRCDAVDKPLRFRGSVRLRGLGWRVREDRLGGYLCAPCARRQALSSLIYSAVLGWWSAPSLFFHGWRATYQNCRSLRTWPRHPDRWGALNVAELIEPVRAQREAAQEEDRPVEPSIVAQSSLHSLSKFERALVTSSYGLYEVLGAHRSATKSQLRSAYRARCKETHPDLTDGTPTATEAMARLNRAWEILRSQKLRAAYDWLESERARYVA
jgi:DnaJ domain